MKSYKTGLVIVLASFLVACSAGINFVKPSDDQVVLEKTTKSQVLALLGKPFSKGQKVTNGENIDVINYAYANLSDKAVFDGVTPARSIGFLFHNNILVGKEYTSSFKIDNTYYDNAKAKSIHKGMTQSQVVAMLGEAGGEYRYPLVADRHNKALVYLFTQTKGFKSQRNVLIVEFNHKGIVQKSEYSQTGQL